MKENHEACAKAAYALGNFWYAARQYDNAIACWETSAAIDPAFPTVWRNLSLAYYNKRNDHSDKVRSAGQSEGFCYPQSGNVWNLLVFCSVECDGIRSFTGAGLSVFGGSYDIE
jgi:tetratricopeptide (TPR) repeat protein